MSAIHELTSIAPLPEFDVFTVPPTQMSVHDSYDVEYRPLAPVTADTPIEFQIRSSEHHYAVPSEIYLQMEIEISLEKVADGSNAPVEAYTATNFRAVNNLLGALFKTVEVIVGGKVFKLQPQMYPYRGYFENFFGYDMVAQATFLKLSLWGASDADLKKSVAPGSDAKPKKFLIYGRLNTDITHQKKSLLGGSKIDIRLEPNDVSFYTVQEENTTYTLADYKAKAKFHSAVLNVHFQEVTEFLRLGHNQALARGTAKYPLTHTDIRHFTVGKGQNDLVLPNAIQGNLPRRSFVFFVDNAALNGSRSKDPFKFLHCYVSALSMEIDGRSFPTLPHKTDFVNKNWVKPYMDLIRILDQNVPHPYLTYPYAYFDKFPVFVIPFCPDLSSNCGYGGHVSPIHTNKHVTLKVTFDKPLEQVTSVIIYSEYDDIVEFDAERNCVSAING